MRWVEIYALSLVITPIVAVLIAVLVCWRDTRRSRPRRIR